MNERKTTKKGRRGKGARINVIEAAQDGYIDSADAQRVVEFVDYYATMNKLGASSFKKYHYALTEFLHVLKARNKTLESMDENDALSLIRYVQQPPLWGEYSRADYLDKFQRFYGWAHKRYGAQWNPAAVDKFIGKEKYVYRRDKNKISRKTILAPQQVLALISAEQDLGYKTFWAAAYESGSRGCELLTLKIKDVAKDAEKGYTLNLSYSKTEKRPVPLVEYSPDYLSKWLQNHPFARDPEAPLFTNLRAKPLTHPAAAKRLKALCAQLGIKGSDIGLHTLRRSRATELASRGLSTFQMCRLLGWSLSSKMPEVYIRESAIDVRGALLKSYGYVEDSKQFRPVGVQCFQCSKINPEGAISCDICNMPLDAVKYAEAKSSADMGSLSVAINDIVQEKIAEFFESQTKKKSLSLE